MPFYNSAQRQSKDNWSVNLINKLEIVNNTDPASIIFPPRF